MPNKVFLSVRIVCQPFSKNNRNKKCDNCVKPNNQREKVLIGKHIDFSALWIRSTLIVVKVGTNLVSSFLFKPLFSTYAMTERKNVQMMC